MPPTTQGSSKDSVGSTEQVGPLTQATAAFRSSAGLHEQSFQKARDAGLESGADRSHPARREIVKGQKQRRPKAARRAFKSPRPQLGNLTQECSPRKTPLPTISSTEGSCRFFGASSVASV